MIGRINGGAFGGGVGLIAVCDITLASPGLTFAFSETKLGLIPSVISPYVIRRIGPAPARRLFITGERFSSDYGTEIGLIDYLVDSDTIDEKIEQIIKDSVNGIGPFSIKLKGTGVFPNKNYIRIVWIGIKDIEKLVTIAKNIDEKIAGLGFKKEKRGFSAHLTIGRVKTAKNKDVLLKKIENYSDFDFGIQEVKSIKLTKSDLTPKGPIYLTMKEITL